MGGSGSKGKSWSKELHNAMKGTALSNRQKIEMLSKVKELVNDIMGDVKISVNIDGEWLDDIGTGENVLEVYATKDGDFEYIWAERTIPSSVVGFCWSVTDIILQVAKVVAHNQGLIKQKEDPMIEWHGH